MRHIEINKQGYVTTNHLQVEKLWQYGGGLAGGKTFEGIGLIVKGTSGEKTYFDDADGSIESAAKKADEFLNNLSN